MKQQIHQIEAYARSDKQRAFQLKRKSGNQIVWIDNYEPELLLCNNFEAMSQMLA